MVGLTCLVNIFWNDTIFTALIEKTVQVHLPLLHSIQYSFSFHWRKKYEVKTAGITSRFDVLEYKAKLNTLPMVMADDQHIVVPSTYLFCSDNRNSAVNYRSNVVNVLQTTHNRHSIAGPNRQSKSYFHIIYLWHLCAVCYIMLYSIMIMMCECKK